MSVKNHFNCLKFSLVATFLLFLQTTFSQKNFAAVDRLLEEQKKALGTTFSVMVVTADTVLYQKAVGDVQPKTPAPIGAASQWLTTALVMQLVDDGKLSLDDRIEQYLPVFSNYFKGYITIRHCLTHQTGIGTDGLFKQAAMFGKTKLPSLEEVIPYIAKTETHANTGEQFRYTNYGPFIAARVAEIVSKKRFDQIIRTRLFVPLGMRNTTFTTDDGTSPNPAVGAKTTAADYSKFLQMLLNGGKAANGKPILSQAAIEEMRTVQIAQQQMKAVPPVAQGFGFALGSWLVEGNNTPGEKATVMALPSLNGTWPMIDFSRRYAFLVLAKEFSGEQNAKVYTNLKELADRQFPAGK